MDHLVPKHGTDEWKASESNVDSHKHKFCWACRHGPMNMTEKFCLNPKCGIRQPVLTTDCVGILRLDGANYSGKQSVAGDVAAGKDTFDYDVMYMRVEGYSFSACKAGPRLLRDGSWKLPTGRILVPSGSDDEKHLFYPVSGKPGVPRQASRVEQTDAGTAYVYEGAALEANLRKTIKHLTTHNKLVGLSSACGFWYNANALVREFDETAGLPVLLSSLALLPLISASLPPDARIGVLTANGNDFADYFEKLIPPELGVPHGRVKLIGCENVQGFGMQVEAGKTVDDAAAHAGLVALVQKTMDKYAGTPLQIRALLLECTELPGYTNALRKELRPRIPVYDAVNLVDFVHQGLVDADYEHDSHRDRLKSGETAAANVHANVDVRAATHDDEDALAECEDCREPPERKRFRIA